MDETRCPSCGHLPGCECPEDCPAIIAAEAARLAELDRFFAGHKPLASRFDDDPFAMFDQIGGAA